MQSVISSVGGIHMLHNAVINKVEEVEVANPKPSSAPPPLVLKTAGTYSEEVFHLPLSALTLSENRQKPPQASTKTF